MLWLWMQSAWDMTFTRVLPPSQGGSYQIGVIGTLGATAFSEVMTNMNLEFPMLTMASQMNQTLYG